MPVYVEKVLHQFQHPTITTPENQPYKHVVPNYSEQVQCEYIKEEKTIISKQGIKELIQIVGDLLFYAHMAESNLMVAISDLASEQSKVKEDTNQEARRLMDYRDTYPNGVIQYHPSKMGLAVHIDTFYLLTPNHADA